MSRYSGPFLRMHRKAASISQKDLAIQLDISPAYVNLIENGRRPLTAGLAAKIAEILGIEIEELDNAQDQNKIRILQEVRDLDHLSLNDKEAFVAQNNDWANVIIRQNRQLNQLKDQLSMQDEWLGQDRTLSDALHSLLSQATSIRSTASILNTQGEVPAQMSARFREIVHHEARNLSHELHDLVAHIDAVTSHRQITELYHSQLSQWFADRDNSLDDLEQIGPELKDPNVLLNWLHQEFDAELIENSNLMGLFSIFAKDIYHWPREKFLPLAQENDWHAQRMILASDAAPDRVLRRIATVSKTGGRNVPMLSIRDQTGFYWLDLPLLAYRSERLQCPFWPIFDAPFSPGMLIQKQLNLGQDQQVNAMAATSFRHQGQDISMRLTTMIADMVEPSIDHAQPSGITCSTCQIEDCKARRNRANSKPISIKNNAERQ